MPGGLKVKYESCLGPGYDTVGVALILPDTAADCIGLQGFHATFALNWPWLEDKNLIVEAVAENFTENEPSAEEDYFTVAFND